MALQVNEAVMALEAEVQQDPDNSDAWLIHKELQFIFNLLRICATS